MRHLDTSLLQKRVVELQASSQVRIATISLNDLGVVVIYVWLVIYEMTSTRAGMEGKGIRVGFQSFSFGCKYNLLYYRV